MMQKNRPSFEWQQDDKTYLFLCPPDGNWNTVKFCATELANLADAQIAEANKPKEPISEPQA